MFSPLNILIKPSRIKRWLYIAIYLLAFFSLLYSSTPLVLKALVLAAISLGLFYELKDNDNNIYLFWDLDHQVVKVAFAKDESSKLHAFEECNSIKELHLLFGVLYLCIDREGKSDVKLLIFSDSVDSDNYRKLLVAAKWAKLQKTTEQ